VLTLIVPSQLACLVKFETAAPHAQWSPLGGPRCWNGSHFGNRGNDVRPSAVPFDADSESDVVRSRA